MGLKFNVHTIDKLHAKPVELGFCHYYPSFLLPQTLVSVRCGGPSSVPRLIHIDPLQPDPKTWNIQYQLVQPQKEYHTPPPFLFSQKIKFPLFFNTTKLETYITLHFIFRRNEVLDCGGVHRTSPCSTGNRASFLRHSVITVSSDHI